MSQPSDKPGSPEELRRKIIGLGEHSHQKSYYPQLQEQIKSLKENKQYLEEKTVALLNILEDLEEEKRENQDLSMICGVARDLFCIMDKDGRFIRLGPMWEEVTGWRSEDLLGVPVYAFVLPAYLEQTQEIFRRLETEDRVNADAEVRCRDGHSIWVSGVATADHSRGVIVATFRDITKRKQLEEALKKANKKLNLLSGITLHDLRNKITAVGTYLLLIPEVTDDPQVCELVERGEEALDSITELVESMKEYESLGDAAPEWVNIGDCLQQVLQETNAGTVSIQIQDELSGVSVYADRMMKNVLFNLIHNSLKHGGKGLSEIRVLYESKDEDLALVCEDNGVGIAEKDKEFIFSQGFHSRRIHGLFLIKEILEITGLQITETGKPECGTRFEILLPAGTFRFADTE